MRAIGLVFVLTSCTTSTALVPSEPHAMPRLTFAQDVRALAWFPVRHSAARLPTADARRGELRALGYDEVSAQLRVCVGANGETSEVRLDHGSGLSWFDEAVRNDVAAWRYEPYRAPSDVRVCEPLTVRYLP